MIEKPDFVRYKLDEEKANESHETISIKINREERALLELVKTRLEQPKDSTAIKTLFKIGAFDVIHDKKTVFLIDTLFKNKKNNARLGVPDFD